MDGMLSQEEINALLGNMEAGNTPESESQDLLSTKERDALGEISNISMGTAATTLSTLVNNKVVITTPEISYVTIDDISKDYVKPCIFIYISYQTGLEGKNVLILKEDDVKIITDLMMGGDGTISEEAISELHLSAISEAMNQMMGSAATSMSSMLEQKVDISPPVARRIDLKDAIIDSDLDEFMRNEMVQVSFKMEIGDLVDSNIMQLFPVEFAKDVYRQFSVKNGLSEETVPETPPQALSQPQPTPPPAPEPMPAPQPMMNQGMQPLQNFGQQAYQQPYIGQPMPGQEINIQPAQFQNFVPNLAAAGVAPENIDLIMDVPLEVTVELGRTNKSIREILDFAPGTIIELNKLAGEPIDVLVNGKFVAKGEVVVIEESFGIRVTDIIKE